MTIDEIKAGHCDVDSTVSTTTTTEDSSIGPPSLKKKKTTKPKPAKPKAAAEGQKVTSWSAHLCAIIIAVAIACACLLRHYS